MKSTIKFIIALILLVGTAQAQTQYCGTDISALLVAKQTLSNMILYSEQIDNAAWTKGAVTVTANSIVAPDGTTTADKITVSATTGSHAVNNATPFTVVDATNYRMSIYAKAGSSPYLKLRSLSPATANISVNLSTGAIVASDVSVISSSIRSVGNGWYLIEMIYAQSGTSAYFIAYTTDSSYNTSWTAVGTEYLYLWGASFNLASAPSSYVKTTSSSATLGPLCDSGTSQSINDPSRCFVISAGNPLKLTPFQGSQTGTNVDLNQPPLTPFTGSSN